ncbi:MAG: choline-sulfatase [Pseudomonadota bacterium]|nr:choline-sulfatase [Pseudomonadota bacterium]
MENSSKPNILLIMADQLTAAAVACYGNPVVKTPNIDRFAEQGTLFENAYCNFPICGPSRASMLTGMLPSRVGAWDNACDFPASVPTMPYYLRELGYRTILSGKMHFCGPDQLHGYEERLVTDIYPADFYWAPDWTQTGHLTTAAGTNMRGVVESGVAQRTLQIDYDEEVHYRSTRMLYDLARSPEDRPFFMTISYTHPHHPFTAQQEFWDLYDRDEIDMPEVPWIPVEERDAHAQRLYYLARMDEFDIGDERVRTARHAYYAMISFIDRKIGELLDTLEQTGLDQNTVVVFVSDHGEMMGERGMWYKMNFYENAVRVPMILRVPGQEGGQRVAAPASLVDLLPTFVDFGRQDAPFDYVEEMDGANLVDIANGIGTDRFICAEYTSEGTIEPCFMLVKGGYKFIWAEQDGAMLYDLNTDPNELVDLSTSPEHTHVMAEMETELHRRWDVKDVYNRCLLSQQRRAKVQKAMMAPGKKPDWNHEPHEPAAERYVRSGIPANLIKSRSRFPKFESLEVDTPRGDGGF